jgi:hypothetical protein
MDFDQDRGLFRIFGNPFEASYEDTEPTLQLELINQHCSDEIMSKFKEGNLLNFCKWLSEDKYTNLWQKVALCANLFGSTFVNKLSH